MNKQRFLAELQRLLVFMTETDRAEVIRRYTELFDAAGPEGEAALITGIGSPTKAAISLSRGYEPGVLPDTFPGVSDIPVQMPQEVPSPEPEEPDDPLADVPSFDLPDYVQDEEETDTAAFAESEEPFAIPDLPGTIRTSDEPAASSGRRLMPLGLGIPLFVIIMAVLGIPLAAVCVCIALALLVPGAAVFFLAFLIAVGGFWCLSFIADAILLFGAAFIVLAFGIIILFVGLWIGVKLIGLYIRGVSLLADTFFRRKEAVHE